MKWGEGGVLIGHAKGSDDSESTTGFGPGEGHDGTRAQAVRGGSTDTVRPVPQSRGDLERQDL